MATLQNLRNKAGVLLAAVIFIALAAFILGDLMKSGSSMLRGKQLEIARIDGESIEYPDFQTSFDELSKVYKNNNQTNNLDDKAYQQILDQTWDNLVQERLMGKVYDELGIDVTSQEMFDMVQGNNLHPIIAQIFGDPQTRQVNKANVIRFLKYIQENPEAPQKESWMSVEKQILSSKKMSKYTDLVGKGFTANSLQAKQSIIERNVTANLKYIQKKNSSVSDNEITCSEAELKKYYEEHRSDFDQKSQKIISYVTFDIKPSADDDAEALNYVTKLKGEFATTENDKQFVNANSDTRFEEKFFAEKDLASTLGMWAFSTTMNDIYGPVKEGDYYKMYKLIDTKMIPDSVKASHILIRVQSQAELQPAMAKIDSLKRLIESGRVSFELAARTNSQDGSSAQGGDLGWFKRGMMVPEFENAAFLAEKDQLVVTQTQFGIHLIKVTVQGPKSKNVEFAIVDRKVTPSTTTYQNTYAEASKFAASAQDLKGFSRIAADRKKTATINENDRTIPGVGSVRPMIRAAFLESKAGELIADKDKSPIFETEDKFIVAAIEADLKKGTKSFEAAKPTIQMAVVREKKEKMFADQFNASRGADIDQTGSKMGLPVGSASGFKLAYGSVNEIGYEPAVNGAISKLEVGQQSKPIVGKNGVYVVQLTAKDGATTGNLEAEKKYLYMNSSYKATYQAFEAIKKNSEIIDNRWKFY